MGWRKGHRDWHDRNGGHRRKCRHRSHRRKGCRHALRGRSLRRVLFLWFLLSLAVTAMAAMFTFRAIGDGERRGHFTRMERFVAYQWARVWPDEEARNQLALDMERELGVCVRLTDMGDQVLRTTSECEFFDRGHPVIDPQGRRLGRVDYCHRHPARWGLRVAAAVVVALLVLIGMSGLLAHRLTAPIRRMATVVERFGGGELSARVGPTRLTGDVAVLADGFDRMAARLARQLDDQRALLAEVSHELRTPLGHLRILLELGREGAAVDWDELSQELEELDELVAQLLARSRIDGGIVDRREVDVVALARRALERQGVSTDKLVCDGEISRFPLDPSLAARALANLIRNAETHGQGLVALHLSVEGVEGEAESERLVFEVVDEGPGFDSASETKEPMGESGGLGIGLGLVESIAAAHDGGLALETPEHGTTARLWFLRPPATGRV